jgi:formimidoylglutamate deiminase
MALVEAARETGIGLTMVPALYRRAGFNRQGIDPGQQGFVLDVEACLRLAERLALEGPVALAIHSLRAVGRTDAEALLAGAPAHSPIHLHIAEQEREVADCVAATGTTPLRWLLDHFKVDDRWALVHATHATPDELAATAKTGATIVLCPTTEANLGDGLFDFASWLQSGGLLAIGSDSNVTVDPAAELCLLEYGARLRERRRLVSVSGSALWRVAAEGGARVAGIESGALALGLWADMIALDTTHPLMMGKTPDQSVDTFLTSGHSRLVSDVWSSGNQVVQKGVLSAPPADTGLADALERISALFSGS